MKYDEAIVAYDSELTVECRQAIVAINGSRSRSEPAVIRAAEGDPKVNAVAKVLQDHGWSEWVDRSRARREGKEYAFNTLRVFELSDYEKAGWFVLKGSREQYVGTGDRVQGTVQIAVTELEDSIRAPIDLGHCDTGWRVVPTHIRKLVETAQFRGIEFESIRLVDMVSPVAKEVRWTSRSITYWHMFSSERAPSIVFIKEGRGNGSELFVDPEKLVAPVITYRREDLQRLEGADFVRSHEHAESAYGWYLVSRRFRDWCLNNSMTDQFEPAVLVD